jgi:hypothetical protein
VRHIVIIIIQFNHNVFKYNHNLGQPYTVLNLGDVNKLYSCLANPAESPVCVITIKPEYSESVRAALEKDKIGFHTKCIL